MNRWFLLRLLSLSLLLKTSVHDYPLFHANLRVTACMKLIDGNQPSTDGAGSAESSVVRVDYLLVVLDVIVRSFAIGKIGRRHTVMNRCC
jgi:hypothetical protein